MSKDKNSGALSLISVLSILAALIAVCAVVIGILVSTGVMNVSWLKVDPSTRSSSSSGEGDVVIRGYEEAGLDEAAVRSVLGNVPFSDTFYSRFFTTYIGRYGVEGVGGIFKIEAYDVYRSKDKYKIITYNNFMQPQRTVVCDGERVRVSDEVTGNYADYELSDAFSFSAVCPMPDFSVFLTGKYEITDFYIVDGEYNITCRHTDADTTDEVHISSDSGALTYFRTDFGGQRMSEYTLFNYDTSYEFADDEFNVD